MCLWHDPTHVRHTKCASPSSLFHATAQHCTDTWAAGNFSEAQTGVCHLENISGIVLEKVVEYFYYNEKYRNSEGVPDMDIPSELCLELLMAADFLLT